MTSPNSPSPQLLEILAKMKAAPTNTLPAQPLTAEDAAAMCLSMVTDPECRVLPADAFRELRDRNSALMNSPRAEIRSALSRQAVILEAVSMRFMAKAAIEKKTESAAALTKISLSASRSLVGVLAALYAMARDAEADEAKAVHAIA